MKRNLNVIKDKSGSCAVILLVTPHKIYVANVGDSRAISSEQYGTVAKSISDDHKPSELPEKTRIIAAGGSVYQSSGITNAKGNVIVGPFRVLPGRLSVSRTFGDVAAKMEKYGGNPNCIIATPEIYTVNNHDELDFILIASDGVFDRLSTEETIGVAVDEMRSLTEKVMLNHKPKFGSFEHVSQACGAAVDKLITYSMEKESLDNLSVVIISFKNLSRFVEGIEPQQGKVATSSLSHNKNAALNTHWRNNSTSQAIPLMQDAL